MSDAPLPPVLAGRPRTKTIDIPATTAQARRRRKKAARTAWRRRKRARTGVGAS